MTSPYDTIVEVNSTAEWERESHLLAMNGSLGQRSSTDLSEFLQLIASSCGRSLSKCFNRNVFTVGCCSSSAGETATLIFFFSGRPLSEKVLNGRLASK